MDHFAELRSIENLKDGVLFKVVEEVRNLKFNFKKSQLLRSVFFSVAIHYPRGAFTRATRSRFDQVA